MLLHEVDDSPAAILTPLTPTTEPMASIEESIEVNAILARLPGILALASMVTRSSLSSGTSNLSRASKNLGEVRESSITKPKDLSMFTALTTAFKLSPTLKDSPLIRFSW